jgi:outer membrane lipoprotein-sorting protein
MNADQNDRLLDETIRRAVGSETARFDSAAWMKKHREEVAILRSRESTTAPENNYRWRTWRTIMGARTMKKIAMPAAAVAAIAIIAIIWAVVGGTSIAMASVLEQLHTKSYEFVMDVRAGDTSTTVKGAVLEPGKLRLEQTGGQGPIVSIIEHDAKHSLLLWERFKAAYLFDKQEQEKEKLGGLGFLILPGRSVSNLWTLRAGKETKLDQKQVDGHTARGFRVTQKSDDYTETITVWADAKTAAPLKVEIALQSNNDEKQVLELTLRDFKVVEKPDPALFSTDVPAGYTLANRQTLKQLATAPATDTSVAKTSPGAEKVLAALRLWHEGNKQKAIETLMTVDWEGNLRFSQKHYLFSMTESQYISLVTDDQQKVMAEIMSQSTDCRAIARKLVDLARKARAAKDDTEAENYLHAAVGLGQLLDRDKNMMLTVRMVGIAIQRLAAGELATMYEAQGQTDKLQRIQRRIRDLEEQMEEIKRTASGQ